ncbi:PhzF family phenazine biosynthesis protein [Sphingomonas sp.]|uniref:PhzF family phenazine biosynthesis protein n=1 Tax=Sphingomonas sp. TaxID=28214 RepID=UPI0025EE0EA4|nr:PhzF family phenazine biosynthesis protein [Sphingomonas sp.]MBV9529087.1 PhzF family phenazine biosynthesis protein [Sphingomonas sp.]
MRRFAFQTVDVFTSARFGGNPLAVFPDASGLSDCEMQRLATEFNLSETTFVLPPRDPVHDAEVRIFTPAHEMPFAGHPNVGTAFVLAGMGRDRGGKLLFEEIAGLVEARIEHDAEGAVRGAEIDAPAALAIGGEVAPELIARCIGLTPGDLRLAYHRPLVASVGAAFAFVEVERAALGRAAPDISAFRDLAANHSANKGLAAVHLYARDGAFVAGRMFAPLSGVLEDPATGSANAALGALLLSLDGGDELTIAATQGVEMGRPSALRVRARRTATGIRSSIAGDCVPVMRGEVTL